MAPASDLHTLPVSRAAARRGLVLIVVLVVLSLLALAATTFSELMLAENQSAQYSGRRLQARAFAESGIEMSIWFLAQIEDTQQQDGGHYDNPDYFKGRLVGDVADGLDPGRFTITAPAFDVDGARQDDRYGLQDESAKINLNAVLAADELQENGGRQLLVKALGKLGMTDELADKILDFIDKDDTPREFGAEADYYAPLGIKPKNGPLESLEELVLVAGVDWRLVFGRDLNRNGRIDDDEAQLEGSFYDDQGEQAQRGWSAFLTIYSAEKNLNPEGQPKIDLNNNDLEALYNQLTEVFDATWATYIIAYRQNGPATNSNNSNSSNKSSSGSPSGGSTGSGSPGGGSTGGGSTGGGAKSSGSSASSAQQQSRTGGLDFEKPGRARLTTVLDIVGVDVSSTTFKGETSAVPLKSPFPDPTKDSSGAAALAKLLDYAAVNVAPVIGGRINVNEAPKVILEALPGIPEEKRADIVAQILQNRDPKMIDPALRHETWLMDRKIVTLDEMKQLLPFVCGHGDIYRADVLGYFDADDSGRLAGPAVRLEVVIDATRPKPRLLFWRDISHLGTKAAMEAAVSQ